MLHEQAIYQHDGECWQVEKFDHENHKAFVRKVEPDYWTDAMTYTQIAVLEESATGPVKSRQHTSGWGEVSVVEKVVGYKKIKFFTHENAGYGDVRLPEMQMHTTAFWLTVPEARLDAMEAPRAATIDALRGVGVALETVATLALMCDPRDLGTTLGDAAPAGEEANGSGERAQPTPPAMKVRGGPRPGYSPTLFLYEHIPGGTGLAQRIFEQRDVLLSRAFALIESCPCVSGCPACVGPCEEPRVGVKGRKSLAIDILSDAIG
jgi:DEAD/DEAH box helicase domain-containing protein